MSMAQLVVTAVLVEGRTRSEVARDCGVSRRWVITLVQRFLADGEPGLAPRSRRPHSSPARTAQAVEDEIIALRKELDRGGHEAGAATIAAHLQQRRHPRPRSGPRPADPHHQHRRRPAPRTQPRPQPGLPTTSPTVNDVARHL